MRTAISAAIVCALARLAAAYPAEDGGKKPAPVYTNEDLRRYSRGREEPPAAPPADATPKPPTRPTGHREAYWRREADGVRERVSVLRADADALRARLAATRAAASAVARPTVSRRRSEDVGVAEAESRLRSLEERIRSLQAAFEERARRDGALPGWLR